jgi:hypothetical protein
VVNNRLLPSVAQETPTRQRAAQPHFSESRAMLVTTSTNTRRPPLRQANVLATPLPRVRSTENWPAPKHERLTKLKNTCSNFFEYQPLLSRALDPQDTDYLATWPSYVRSATFRGNIDPDYKVGRDAKQNNPAKKPRRKVTHCSSWDKWSKGKSLRSMSRHTRGHGGMLCIPVIDGTLP